MAIDLQALKDELNNNPAPMPYLALTADNDVANADILNNADGSNPRTVDNESISAADLVAATFYGAYDGLTAGETAYYDMIVSRERVAVTADTKQTLAGIPTAGGGIWATADEGVMEPRVTALMQRDGSRAEELKDTLGVSYVTPSDVANARRLP